MSTSSFVEDVVKMYNEGSSTYEIAERLGTYPNKIRRTLLKGGCQLKTREVAQENALASGRAGHPTQGKVRTKEEKLKISTSMSSYWDNMGDEERDRRVEISKAQWKSMSSTDKEKMRVLSIEAIQKAAKDGSKLENFILRLLSDNGYATEFHKKNLLPNQNLEIDIYIPELKTIIEVDGPSHFFPIWGAVKLSKQISADTQKNGLILSKGFIIIRIKFTKSCTSLKDEQDLSNLVLTSLSKIKESFPPPTERYIEVEI